MNPNHLPFLIAKNQGFFREAGLDVSILVPTTPEESLDLVAQGKADFGVGEPIGLIRGRAQHRPLVSIGPLLTHTVVGLMYLRDGPIKRLENLRHRRVGWPGPERDQPLLAAMLETAGLTLDDILPVDVGLAPTEALLNGKADAVFGAFATHELVEAEARGASVEFVSPTHYGAPDFYQLVVITSDRMVAKHPTVVRRFTRALAQGLSFTHQHPNEALGTYLMAHAVADPALSAKAFDKTWPYFPESLAQDPARWQAVHDWLLARGALARPIPLEQFFTNRFVPET